MAETLRPDAFEITATEGRVLIGVPGIVATLDVDAASTLSDQLLAACGLPGSNNMPDQLRAKLRPFFVRIARARTVKQSLQRPHLTVRREIVNLTYLDRSKLIFEYPGFQENRFNLLHATA